MSGKRIGRDGGRFLNKPYGFGELADMLRELIGDTPLRAAAS
jgi:hypothetical protein